MTSPACRFPSAGHHFRVEIFQLGPNYFGIWIFNKENQKVGWKTWAKVKFVIIFVDRFYWKRPPFWVRSALYPYTKAENSCHGIVGSIMLLVRCILACRSWLWCSVVLSPSREIPGDPLSAMGNSRVLCLGGARHVHWPTNQVSTSPSVNTSTGSRRPWTTTDPWFLRTPTPPSPTCAAA